MAGKTMKRRSSRSRKTRGGDASHHALSVYGDAGSQSAAQGNLIKMMAAKGGRSRRRRSNKRKSSNKWFV